MVGKYHIVFYGGKNLLFIECLFCNHFTYIPGKKKPHKIHVCWGCDGKVSEP